MSPSTLDDAFAPPGEQWVRVSPLLARAYRIQLVIFALLGAVGIAVLRLVPDMPPAVPAVLGGVLLVVVVWVWVVIGRRVRSWGYLEREDDLTAGPLHRLLGIATVQLHTAAATTDASIPGLRPDVAAGLRDRLARLGEQRSAGL